jgi:HAMP domain-containing protein
MAAFGVVMHFVVQRLLSRRIARLVLAIEHFRRGTWRVRIPARTRDEIEWLTEAIRELGPHLEQKLTTYVEVDRKSVVARLGGRYERRLAPPARRIVDVAWREMSSCRSDLAWQEVLLDAVAILDELESLGRPDHSTVADIVSLKKSADIVTKQPYVTDRHHGTSEM